MQKNSCLFTLILVRNHANSQNFKRLNNVANALIINDTQRMTFISVLHSIRALISILIQRLRARSKTALINISLIQPCHAQDKLLQTTLNGSNSLERIYIWSIFGAEMVFKHAQQVVIRPQHGEGKACKLFAQNLD